MVRLAYDGAKGRTLDVSSEGERYAAIVGKLGAKRRTVDD